MDKPIVEYSDWTPDLETGLPFIDEQHRRLFELAATFHDDDNQVRVMKSLAILHEYIRTHLREEEELMTACGYPRLEEHKAAHAEFRRMFSALLENAKQMSLDAIAQEVRRLVNGWFFRHIMVVDQDYVPAVRASQANQAS